MSFIAYIPAEDRELLLDSHYLPRQGEFVSLPDEKSGMSCPDAAEAYVVRRVVHPTKKSVHKTRGSGIHLPTVILGKKVTSRKKQREENHGDH